VEKEVEKEGWCVGDDEGDVMIPPASCVAGHSDVRSTV